MVTRKESTEIRGNVCCLPSAVNAVVKLSNMMILQLYNSHKFKFLSNNFIIQMKFKIYQVPALRLNRNRILKVYWLADWPSDIWCASFNPVCFLWRQVDFWTQPSLEGAAVDIRLSPTNSYENITSLLTSYGIEFKLQIPNLQSVIDQQNGK